MPDSPFDGKGAAHKPLPQCKALLICEGAGVDAITGQFSLFQLVNSLHFAEFPAQAQPLLVFLQLYDGIGRYGLSIELRDLAARLFGSITPSTFSSPNLAVCSTASVVVLISPFCWVEPEMYRSNLVNVSRPKAECKFLRQDSCRRVETNAGGPYRLGGRIAV